MAKSPEEIEAAMVENLKETTGKTIEQWTKIVAASKLAKHGEIVKHLKAEYKLGHGYANLITHKARAADSQPVAVDNLVDAQYAGPKAALRPLYEKLIATIQQFGDDFELAPKKGYVSLRRSKQFALIQPSTATRLDVGIQLKGTPATDRLEASGSFNAMVSHRVRVTQPSDLDAELESWLRQAFGAA